jgi:hypothetical protein
MSRPPSNADVLAELARVKVLFQARTIAAIIGAPPPAPEAFRCEDSTPAPGSGKDGA